MSTRPWWRDARTLLRIIDHALWSVVAFAALVLLAGDPWYM